MSYIPKKNNQERKFIILEKKLKKRADELNEKIEKNDLVHQQTYRALQDFVRLLTNFASHDIKNAVHNLDGLVTNLKENEISNEDIKSIKMCIDNIRISLDEFKILSSDRDKKKFKVKELIIALESLHRPLLKKYNIKFRVEYKNVEPIREVNLIFHQILQLLNNLIINAFEFLDTNPNNPEIKILVEIIDNNILFYVYDNGLGIKKENETKIFEPYFTTKENGSGVGLSHVKHISELLGGKIEYLGKNNDYNTIFCLTLPLDNE